MKEFENFLSMKLVPERAQRLLSTGGQEADETTLKKGLAVGVNGWLVEHVLDDSAGCRIASMSASTTASGHADANV